MRRSICITGSFFWLAACGGRQTGVADVGATAEVEMAADDGEAADDVVATDMPTQDSGTVDTTSGGDDAIAEPPPCADADHCVTVSESGSIDQPDLAIQAGESITFALANRWQSIIAIDEVAEQACESEDLESAWDPTLGFTGPMPRFSGGIVVRGTPEGKFRFPDEVWKSSAVSGVLLVIPWEDLEPTEGSYDFAVFTDALRQATRHGKLVSIGVQTGARCPKWIYSGPDAVPGTAMVTKATSGEQCFDQVHPSFWHPNYSAKLGALQSALASTVTAHSGWYRHIDKIKISGVNLLTSETRMPVDRSDFCGFEDPVCSGGSKNDREICSSGVCPIAGCGCMTDPADGVDKCGRTTDDLPQVWADAGYRPSKLWSYFAALFGQQHTLFPEKDINLMQISRAFPNVSESGEVKGFADPDDVRALIAKSLAQLPDHFVVLNAALSATSKPQDICLESFDLGVKQIGFQTTNGLNTWAELEPALANARDTATPAGVKAVSFLEIYLNSFSATLGSGDEAALAAYDSEFRARTGEGVTAPRHHIANLPAGTYHYKVGGDAMTGGGCAMGTLTVLP